MTLLHSFELTPYEPTNRSNSFLKRRRKLIAKIDEQILLANDSDYKPTKIKWVHEDGTERKLEIPKRFCTLFRRLNYDILTTEKVPHNV